MNRKFSWLIFFITLFSTVSLCILIIPYPETQVMYNPYELPESGYSSFSSGISFELPWRSFNKELFLNVSLTQGTINLTIFERDVYRTENYIPYWEILNTTGFTTTIKLSPPIKEYLLIRYDHQNITDVFNDIYSEVRVSYLRYASNYGFFFLGLAVVLISYYGYRKYKWSNKYHKNHSSINWEDGNEIQIIFDAKDNQKGIFLFKKEG